MAFVVSEGSVKGLERVNNGLPTYALRLTDDFTQDYAAIWRTQPAVRTVVQFLARNIASLGIHTFRRLSDTDRERLTDHPLAALFARPNPATTRYRLIDALINDIGVYDAAYWLKLKTSGGGVGLVRLPADQTFPTGDNWMWPEKFELRGSTGKKTFDADQVVYFHGYNPDDSRLGCSPIESLRRTLAEEWEAGRMREQILRNGARVSGYIERPKDSAKWRDGAFERFKKDWQAQYAGNGPQAGGTPILEDGMKFVQASQTAQQLQYIEARKLTREEVAAAYFIPPPMVGILDHATFSNIDEQHKMLYQDTLGPWLTMIQEEIGLQLVPDFPDTEQVYVEFNLAEKLRGSFEEQVKSLQSAVGRPWMTAAEARARMNLGDIGGDSHELVTPLNVLIGGQASPRDSAPDDTDAGEASRLAGGRKDVTAARRSVRVKARAPETYETKAKQVLVKYFRRQGASIRSELGAKSAKASDWWDEDRWNGELAADLFRLMLQTSKAVAEIILSALGFGADDYDEARTLAFLDAVSERVAKAMNAATKRQLDEALASDDPAAEVKKVFEQAEELRAPEAAVTITTSASGFGAVEAGKQAGGDQLTKTWLTGPDPRPTHAAIDRETVGIDERFSNGALWPGDVALPPSETANCNCELDINIP